MKREGTLTMTCENDSEYRLDIRFPDGTYYGGLHCGECLEIAEYTERLGTIWKPTRVESGFDKNGDDEWYLVGLYKPGKIPHGLNVRI